ncbi:MULTISPECIES: hypothetical protein [Streptomyces]|uniref:Uncharacterized protein n=1 Tax=Streptomyces flavochromogenes TaxID=68199 RepID=A0ABW6Y4B3_9ACTN
MQQHTTPAQIRAAAEEQIRPLGEKRKRLMAELEELDRELRPLVVHAIRNEVTYRRVQEITGLSPNTSRTWLNREGGRGGRGAVRKGK